MTAAFARVFSRLHHGCVECAGTCRKFHHLAGFFIDHKTGRVPADNVFLQNLLIGIHHFPMRFFLHSIGSPESDAPIKEQPQAGFHGMGAGFHHNKAPFGNGLEFIRRHEGALHHLQRLTGVIFPSADTTAHDGTATQRLGEYLGCLTVWSEAAEDGVLTVAGSVISTEGFAPEGFQRLSSTSKILSFLVLTLILIPPI
jgi:hypothetical protein